MSAPNNRLLALDVIRGITIAGMILVNNPGSWQSVYAPVATRTMAWINPHRLGFSFLYVYHGRSHPLLITQV